MNPLLHWHETNPSARPAPEPKKKKQGRPRSPTDGRVRSGLKAKPIVYAGVTYTTWAEACAATGKTADAIRWAIKTGAK